VREHRPVHEREACTPPPWGRRARPSTCRASAWASRTRYRPLGPCVQAWSWRCSRVSSSGMTPARERSPLAAVCAEVWRLSQVLRKARPHAAMPPRPPRARHRRAALRKAAFAPRPDPSVTATVRAPQDSSAARSGLDP
jgi:hypothetical protein